MVDIHTHVIPFVDDGSSSLQDSLEMIKNEVSAGINTIIATPHHIKNHYECSVEQIKENFNLLKEKVKEENIPVNLLLGQEICYRSSDKIIEKLNNHELLTLDETNLVLLEFSFVKEPDDILEIMYNFKCNNYEVILAHVERYEWMTFELVKTLKEYGVYIQVNANSVIGVNEGKHKKRFVKKLLKHQLVDIVASDVHSFRKSNMDKAYNKLHDDNLFNGLNKFNKVKV